MSLTDGIAAYDLAADLVGREYSMGCKAHFWIIDVRSTIPAT